MRNHIIMDFAAKYVKCQKLETGILAPINQMRIWKRVYLPCKLVGLNGMEQMREFREINAKSSIVWKYNFDQVPNLSKKTKNIW